MPRVSIRRESDRVQYFVDGQEVSEAEYRQATAKAAAEEGVEPALKTWTPGWYWYRSTHPHDPASSGDWVVLYVFGDGYAGIADTAARVSEMNGEWRGPLVPPSEGVPPDA